MNQAQDCTVFFADNGFQDNGYDQDDFAGIGLQAMIDLAVKRWPDSRLVAWATDSVYERGYRTVLDESIAAGRVIDCINGTYVARGVAAEEEKQIDPRFAAAHYGHDLIPAVQEEKPAELPVGADPARLFSDPTFKHGGYVWLDGRTYRRPSPTPTLDKLANTAEPKRPSLTWATKTPFDAFPGFATSSDSDAQDSAAKVCATGRFYDEGWNAAHDGLPFDPKTTRDWRDGWNDYQDAGPEHKVRLDGMLSEAVRESTTAKPALAALTRLSDVHAPLHGSAHLVG